MPTLILITFALLACGILAVLIALFAVAARLSERRVNRASTAFMRAPYYRHLFVDDDLAGNALSIKAARPRFGLIIGVFMLASTAGIVAVIFAFALDNGQPPVLVPEGQVPALLLPARPSEFAYDGGRFVEAADRAWVEQRAGGPPSEFVETDRSREYVQLYDAHRRLAVRLYADRAVAHDPASRGWIAWPGSDGHWR